MNGQEEGEVETGATGNDALDSGGQLPTHILSTFLTLHLHCLFTHFFDLFVSYIQDEHLEKRLPLQESHSVKMKKI